jgi:hypothetical protein
MSGPKVRMVSFALALVGLCLAGACASLQVPGNATTQALGDASAVTGALATGAALAPAPWGQIAASALGAISVIAGIIAHSTVSKNNAQQVASAVETGIEAASQTLGIGSSSATPANAANTALK